MRKSATAGCDRCYCHAEGRSVAADQFRRLDLTIEIGQKVEWCSSRLTVRAAVLHGAVVVFTLSPCGEVARIAGLRGGLSRGRRFLSVEPTPHPGSLLLASVCPLPTRGEGRCNRRRSEKRNSGRKSENGRSYDNMALKTSAEICLYRSRGDALRLRQSDSAPIRWTRRSLPSS